MLIACNYLGVLARFASSMYECVLEYIKSAEVARCLKRGRGIAKEKALAVVWLLLYHEYFVGLGVSSFPMIRCEK